ncbi:MAG: WecB/TagA/CpsF family glycosyltransferase [Candidatus Omnitrophica bacterium]|nr:WecB/TagA/CpsF family glycosyltransferase [Candidatus Omnitrophota bacterium]
MPTNKQRIRFFGGYIDPLTMEETLNCVEEIIRRRIMTQHVVINVAKLVMMQKDGNLREAVNSCRLINCDGAGILWAARLLGFKIPERVAGIDLMLNLVKLAAEKKFRIFLLGATKEICLRVEHKFQQQYPGIQIVGCQDGYFKKEEELTVVEKIKDSCAEILFVALPSPKKEIFLNKYIQQMQVPFVMGVGGSFDVVAGKVKRAPKWMQDFGLEWFYRMISEPGRMWKRYLTTNTVFAWMVLKALVTGKKN